MAIAYHRDQAGAPALVYNTTSGANAHFTALKTILKACLVTGYGSQAAAGWALIAEGTNYIVLRNGTHSGYVCLSWVTGGAVRVWLAETFTGMSGDVMTGAGLKTGTAANNATPQAIGASYVAYSDAATAWKLVADSKTFVINNLSGPSASSASAVLPTPASPTSSGLFFRRRQSRWISKPSRRVYRGWREQQYQRERCLLPAGV